MVPSFSAMRGVLLYGALWSLVTAEAGSLGKRDSLLSPRQEECLTPGWIPVCPGAFPCIPPGAICCSDDITYVLPPDVCPDGTSPVATAVTSDTASSSTATITAAPEPTTITEFTWYTWTITYYYYYYYYTYFSLELDLTSTETTFYTTVSASATDEVQASSLLAELSATLSDEIPSQTATTTIGDVPVETYTPAPPPLVTSVSGTVPFPTGNESVPTTGLPSQYTGGASGSKVVGSSVYFGKLVVAIIGAGMAVPAVFMIWL